MEISSNYKQKPKMVHVNTFDNLLITFSLNPTLPCHYKACHAVRDTGACSQKCDSHDDIWDAQSVADDCHLNRARSIVSRVLKKKK